MSNKFTPIQQITITVETNGQVVQLRSEINGFSSVFEAVGVLEAAKRDILEDADSLALEQVQEKPVKKLPEA